MFFLNITGNVEWDSGPITEFAVIVKGSINWILTGFDVNFSFKGTN